MWHPRKHGFSLMGSPPVEGQRWKGVRGLPFVGPRNGFFFFYVKKNYWFYSITGDILLHLLRTFKFPFFYFHRYKGLGVIIMVIREPILKRSRKSYL